MPSKQQKIRDSKKILEEKKKLQEEVLILSQYPKANPDLVLRMNKKGKILDSHNFYKKKLLKELQVTSKNIYSIFPKNYKSEINKTLKNNKQTNDFEYTFKDKILEIQYSPFNDRPGEVFIRIKDSTERKKLENKLIQVDDKKERLNFILKNLGEGFFILDKDGKIIDTNKIALQILNADRAKIINKQFDNIFKIFDEKYKEEKKNLIQNVISNKSIKKTKLILINRDNNQFNISLCGFPINKNGINQGGVLVFHDISLEDEIDKIKTEFVSIASHQLRTPLASIKWTLELLLAENKGLLNNRQKQLISRIKESNENMISLVNNLLKVSRIEYGKITPKKLNLNLSEIINKNIEEIKPSLQRKQQKIKTQGLNEKHEINSDPQLVYQIFQNLLSNASKYSRVKGDIKLKVKKDKQSTLLEITDNGFGIPKNQQHRLFQKFFRADNVILKETEGTGLGLYLVKSFLELLDGEIWFDSKYNKGTTFYVKLPKNEKK